MKDESRAVGQPPIIVCVSNPKAFAGRGSVIVLEMAGEDVAVKVARKIAKETGRSVTVKDANQAEIEFIPAASTH